MFPKLTLTDRSVTVQRETSSALGQGCRLGFLGTLHMDVFRQRLEDEYDANVIITAPTVPYKSKLMHSLVAKYRVPSINSFPVIYKDKEAIVSNPTDFPDVSEIGVRVKSIQEPVVKASIIVPEGMSFTPCSNLNIIDETSPLRVFWRHDRTLLLPSGRRIGASLS